MIKKKTISFFPSRIFHAASTPSNSAPNTQLKNYPNLPLLECRSTFLCLKCRSTPCFELQSSKSRIHSFRCKTEPLNLHTWNKVHLNPRSRFRFRMHFGQSFINCAHLSAIHVASAHVLSAA